MNTKLLTALFVIFLIWAVAFCVLPKLSLAGALDAVLDALRGRASTLPALLASLLVIPSIEIRTVTIHIGSHPYDDDLYEAWVTGGNHEQAYAQTGDQLSKFIKNVHAYYVNGTFRDYHSGTPVTHVVEIERHCR